MSSYLSVTTSPTPQLPPPSAGAEQWTLPNAGREPWDSSTCPPASSLPAEPPLPRVPQWWAWMAAHHAHSTVSPLYTFPLQAPLASLAVLFADSSKGNLEHCPAWASFLLRMAPLRPRSSPTTPHRVGEYTLFIASHLDMLKHSF